MPQLTVSAAGFEGRYAELLDHTVGFESDSEEADMAPLFVELPDDRCQCSHFGYVKKGSVTYRTADGEETFHAGDAYVVGPGHMPVLHPGTELVEFSPTAELNPTMHHRCQLTLGAPDWTLSGQGRRRRSHNAT